jgi:ABC-type lipoprotein release transport system permease subunit
MCSTTGFITGISDTCLLSPGTYALTCLLIVLTALVAMAVPLRRAVSIEPQQVLRES